MEKTFLANDLVIKKRPVLK
jgi:branched-chain amino acid aminotransferase